MQIIKNSLLGLSLISFFLVNCNAKRSEVAYSIKHGDFNRVKELIEENKGLLLTKEKSCFAENLSLLHWSIYNKKHEILEYLLSQFIKNNIIIENISDSKDRNLLLYATEQADPTSLKLLIKFGMKLPEKYKARRFLFKQAVWGHGNSSEVVECCKILLKEGLRYNFSNHDLDSISRYLDEEITNIAKKGMSHFAKFRNFIWKIL
ncbi:MAG: ankyrin repeat domain-containing protein [bacterium]